jgi:hypothetical protein
MEDKENSKASQSLPASPVCGIVMPISAIDNCTESHWSDVQEILSNAIEEAGFTPNIVSNADDVGIIQKRIIQNLYENPIVVCDVSGKNPNVMFELGMRLAFDKPTIIVKDDKTSYSFDTSPIEHLSYPRDLRFAKIVEFKEELKNKIQATHKKATSDTSYTTFLKHFGKFTVAKLDTQEVSREDFILEELRSLRQAVGGLPRAARDPSDPFRGGTRGNRICVHATNGEEAKKIISDVLERGFPEGGAVKEISPDHFHLTFFPDDKRADILEVAKQTNKSSRWLRQRIRAI